MRLPVSKPVWTLLLGVLIGILVTGVGAFIIIPTAMMKVQTAPGDLETTVATIKERAAAEGWVVSGVVALDESIRQHGGPEVARVRLVHLCQPQHAAAIIDDPAARKVSVFMPCTVSVYETDDGEVHVSAMNTSIFGRFLGGTTAQVMGQRIGPEQENILAFLED